MESTVETNPKRVAYFPREKELEDYSRRVKGGPKLTVGGTLENFKTIQKEVREIRKQLSSVQRRSKTD